MHVACSSDSNRPCVSRSVKHSRLILHLRIIDVVSRRRNAYKFNDAAVWGNNKVDVEVIKTVINHCPRDSYVITWEVLEP